MNLHPTAPQKIKLVIFDIDGTLADTVPLILSAYRSAIEPLIHRPLSDEEIKTHFGPDEEGSVRSILPQDTARGTHDFIQQYKSQHPMCPAAFPGITELLQLLKDNHVRLAIATAKRRDTTDFTLDFYQLDLISKK